MTPIAHPQAEEMKAVADMNAAELLMLAKRYGYFSDSKSHVIHCLAAALEQQLVQSAAYREELADHIVGNIDGHRYVCDCDGEGVSEDAISHKPECILALPDHGWPASVVEFVRHSGKIRTSTVVREQVEWAAAYRALPTSLRTAARDTEASPKEAGSEQAKPVPNIPSSLPKDET